MKIISLKHLFLSFLLSGILFAQTPLEYELSEDIKDHQLEELSHIEAAFILSGAVEQDTLDYYLDWYNGLLETIENFNLDRIDRIGSAAKVFSYLHSTTLKKYKEEATTLINVVHEKRFNCVAGTILYNLLCEDLGWPTEAFETPTHTYTIFPNFTEQIMVENTSVMGFDIMKNLHEYSRYLRQFYPEQQRLKIGLDRIYAYENSKGRSINNTELLGLLAYNRAYFANRDKDYAKAFEFVQLAQSFNQDSRSNVNFEIGLYYRWGKKLFDLKKYYDAFHVYADAYYRYWENNDFARNCRTAFFNAQFQLWQQKNWQKSSQLTSDILELELLDEEKLQQLEKILLNWGQYFIHQKLKKEALDVLGYLNEMNPEGPQTQQLLEVLEKF